MLIPSILLFYLIVTNKNKLDLVFSKEVLKKIKREGGLGRIGRNIMLSIASLFMIIALARPVLDKGEVNVENKSIDILVSLDVSASMRAKDFYPNRLSFAKEKLFRFLDNFPQAEVGVLAFSYDIFMLSPKTEDFNTIKYLVKNLSYDSITSKGTDFMLPIKAAEKFLKGYRDKILVIFTDGGDQKDFTKEIEEAKKHKIKVYVYAIGTKRGDYIDVEGKKVLVKLNENIQNLAKETGGAFVLGDYGDEDIKLLIEEIKKGYLNKTNKNIKKLKEYKELFYYPLALAIAFLLFAFSSLPSKSKIFLIFLFFFANADLKADILDFWRIKRAKESYFKKDYYKSAYYFEKVAKSKNSPQSYYDLANAYYKQKAYKKAIENYEKVITDDKGLNFIRYYNEGNAYFKLKDYKSAIKMYETARKFGEDEDLLFNLELAKRMLKQKKKTKPKKGKKESKRDKKNEQKSNKGSKKSESNKTKSGKNSKKSDKEKASFKKEIKKIKKSISDMEEKKWERVLEKRRPKTLPIKIDIQRKKKVNENPW